MLEFITLTGEPTAQSRNETSKQVRQQAMRDYLAKQSRQASTLMIEEIVAPSPQELSTYKGRFKLSTWSRKTKKLSDQRSNYTAKHRSVQDRGDFGRTGPPKHTTPTRDTLTGVPAIPGGSRLDPFNSLSLSLGYQGERLLRHCRPPMPLSTFSNDR